MPKTRWLKVHRMINLGHVSYVSDTDIKDMIFIIGKFIVKAKSLAKVLHDIRYRLSSR